jgi:hypothetical protein
MLMRSRATDGRSASRCQQKWPDPAPRPPLGASTVTTAGRAASPSCQSAGKTQKFMAVGESSGEDRMKDSRSPSRRWLYTLAQRRAGCWRRSAGSCRARELRARRLGPAPDDPSEIGKAREFLSSRRNSSDQAVAQLRASRRGSTCPLPRSSAASSSGPSFNFFQNAPKPGLWGIVHRLPAPPRSRRG